MASSHWPPGQFNTEALVQPGVATSYNRRSGERPLHTTTQLPVEEQVTEEWYETNAFYLKVKKFHEDHAREPEMSAAKAIHERLNEIIATSLRAMDICKRLEYKGSAYEGINVNKSPTDPDPEFDILVIMVGGDQLDAIPIPGKPGFARLHNKSSPLATSVQMESLVVDGQQFSDKTSRKFFGSLQKVINCSDEMKDHGATLHEHSESATQMNVFTSLIGTGGKPTKLYSVDYVPAYEIEVKEDLETVKKIYLVKSLDIDGKKEIVWRECFSLAEKNKLKGIDWDKGCRRQVIRIMKVIRNASKELQALSSFHFKMAAFYVIDEKQTRNSWAFDRLGVRVIDVLKKLEEFLIKGFMPLYHLQSVNLFEKLTVINIKDLRNRIHILCTSKTELIKVMENYGK